MFNMFRHQGNTNQKYFEISFYFVQNNLNSNQTNDSNAAENTKKNVFVTGGCISWNRHD